jgi:solute carrier family 35, member E1
MDKDQHVSGLQVGGSIGLFTLMTMLSLLILAPIALLKEGLRFTPGAMSAIGITNPTALMQKATIAALTFHLYQQVSYMILARVSPVTHSVGNCIKRCVSRCHLLVAENIVLVL